MAYYRTSIGFGRPWTPVVRALILTNAAVWILQLLDAGQLLEYLFGLDTARVLGAPMPWQFFSYQFLHGGIIHLLFNMFALWMFGSDMEEWFGSREFLFYYLLCGVGAGICVWAMDLLSGSRSLTVGASGAVFGILLAFGLAYPRRQITLLLFLVLPVTMEARIFVAIFAVLELLLGVSGGTTLVAHFAHLGGMLTGFLYIRLLRDRLRPYLFGRRPFRGLLERWKSEGDMDDRQRLDGILDKINRYGIHTLTDGERKFLEKMSKRAH